jgi:hypothetical protein
LRPDEQNPAEQPNEPTPRGKVLPFPSRRAAPDWLVGPGDQIGTAADPGQDLPREELEPRFPAPVLLRPAAGAPPAPAAPAPREAGLEEGASPGSGAATNGADGDPSWAGPFDDMTRVPSGSAMAAPRASAPEPARGQRAWAPAASSAPTIRIPLPAEPPPAAAPRPGAAPPSPVPVPGMTAVPALAPPPPEPALREPGWLIALDAVRGSRALQAAVVCGVIGVLVLGSFLWPRGVGTVPLGRMRREPTRYDGSVVTVRGRVGDDVFSVGTGWAFYLMQGRDTIVAFMHTRSPRPHEVVTMRGQVSTGFLDGVARQALFETADSTAK